MLRPIEAQAVLRTVFSLWKRQHDYLKSVFRNKIRANAFFKSVRLRQVLAGWKRAHRQRKRRQLKGLEVAANHRRVLADKSLAALLNHILDRRRRAAQDQLADKACALALTRRVIALLHRNVDLSLWKTEANRTALISWRSYIMRKCFAGLRAGSAVLAEEARLNEAAAEMRQRHAIATGLQRLHLWALGSPVRTRLRAESLFAWKRSSARRALTALLRSRGTRMRLKACHAKVISRQGFWAKKKAITGLRRAADIKKWQQDLQRQAAEFQTVVSPVHRLAQGLRYLQAYVVCHRKRRAQLTQAAAFKVAATFLHFKKACDAARSATAKEVDLWRRKRTLEVCFGSWSEQTTHVRRKVAKVLDAKSHYEERLAGRCVAAWRLFVESRSRYYAIAQAIKLKVRLGRLRVLMRYWLKRKRYKEELGWKKKMAESQNSLRLFRLLMSACAKQLHLRRTKEYADEMHRSHFTKRIFGKWALTVSHDVQLKATLRHFLTQRTKTIFTLWSALGVRRQLLYEKGQAGKRIRAKWLKKIALRSFRVFLELSMGAITKRRYLVTRRRHLTLANALEAWQCGIESARADKQRARTLRAMHACKVAKYTLLQWRLKLQQKFAKRSIKWKRVQQAKMSIDKLCKRMCLAKWVLYYEKRLGKLQITRTAVMYEEKTSKLRFMYRLRQFHCRTLEQGRATARAVLHYYQSLQRSALARLKEFLLLMQQQKLQRVAAVHQWASCRYRYGLLGLRLYTTQRKWKKQTERAALQLRSGDLIAAALQRIARVGREWKDERSKVATRARLQKEKRVWRLVAKCAQKWKARTLLHRKKVELPVAAETPKKERPPLATERSTGKMRPAPRRLHSHFSSAPVEPKVDPGARLEGIERELLEFRIEREKVNEYEQCVVSQPENPSLAAQLAKMKDRLNAQKPRVRELLEELQRLRR